VDETGERREPYADVVGSKRDFSWFERESVKVLRA
jgi:hypothetical protein